MLSNADLLRQQLEEFSVFKTFYPIYSVIVTDKSEKSDKNDVCSSICSVRYIINILPFVEERRRLLDTFNNELRQTIAPKLMDIINRRNASKDDFSQIEKQVFSIIDRVLTEVIRLNKRPFVDANENELIYNIDICNLLIRDIKEKIMKDLFEDEKKREIWGRVREKAKRTNTKDLNSLKELVVFLIDISNDLDLGANNKSIKQ